MHGPRIMLVSLVLRLALTTTAVAQQSAELPARYILEYPVVDSFCPPVRTFFAEVELTVERVRGQTFRHQLNGGYGLPVKLKRDGKNLVHLGADVGWYRVGEPVFAVANGVVRISKGPFSTTSVGRAKPPHHGLLWGNLVVIEHRLPDKSYITTIYGHLGNDRAVEAGEIVRAGQKIGTIGQQSRLVNGGYKPHLHFGIVKRRIGEKGSVLFTDEFMTLTIHHVTEEYIELDGADRLPEKFTVFIGNGLVPGEQHDGIRRVSSSVLWNNPGLSFPLRGYGLSTALWHDPVAFLKEHQAHVDPAPFDLAVTPSRLNRRGRERERSGRQPPQNQEQTQEDRLPGRVLKNIVAGIPSDVPSPESHAWRDQDGKTLIKGEFVNLHSSVLTVRTRQNRKQEIPLSDLAIEEQLFAANELLRQRQVTINFFEKYGGQVRRDESTPEGRVVSVGLPHKLFTAAHVDNLVTFSHLKSLHLRNVTLNDPDLAVLPELPELESLYLDNCGRISDKGLVHFAHLRQLEDVRITRTRIRGEGLKHLAALPHLRRVFVTGDQISNRALAELVECRQLESLTIHGGKITNAGLRHLGQMTGLRDLYLTAPKARTVNLSHLQKLKKLRFLVLTNTPVRDEALLSLNQLSQLERLLLAGTKVTDTGLAHLHGLKNLTHLELRGTQITDNGLKHLERLVKLKWINLWNTNTTPDGIKSLQAALPEAEIWYPDQQ